MRRFLKPCLSVMVAASLVAGVPAQAAVRPVEKEQNTQEIREEKGEYAQGEAVIMYTDSSSVTHALKKTDLGTEMWIEETYEFADADDTALGGKAFGRSSAGGVKVSLVKSDIYSTKELIAKLRARADVIAAEPNYKIHTLDMGNDTYAKYQWALDNQGQNGGIEDLDIHAAQDVLTNDAGEKECVVALVDTGIDYTHEELADVVWNNSVASGQLKGRHGYDFINYDADPMDDNGHGTHCSGIMAAASGNGVGIEGVANSKNIKIMALKILNQDGEGYGMEAVGAYNYIYRAQKLGVNVVAVNNSWGGMDWEESEIMSALIELTGKGGAISVCAAGNDAADNDITTTLPANIDSKYIISVAASNERDELAAFSNYGRETVDLAAPGADILSTVSYDCFNPGIYENRDELCSVFEDFSDGELVRTVGVGELSSAKEGEIAYGFGESDGKAQVSLELSDEAYFGLKGANEKSLKWSLTGAKAGENYTLYLPYTTGESKTPLYESLMIKAVGPTVVDEDISWFFDSSIVDLTDAAILEDGRIEEDAYDLGAVGVDAGNYWSHLSAQSISETDGGEKRTLAVSLIVMADGDYEIYLDNMGVSKENAEAEAFGKYDYYNGTSMATPYVTGAVAALANAFGDEDARERVLRLLGCTRRVEGLTDLVSTGGVLDLSLVENPHPALEGMKLDANKNIRIEGRFIEDASVYVNGDPVTPVERTENALVLSSKGLMNKALNVMVEKDDNELYTFGFFADGKEFSQAGHAWGILNGGSAVSNGEILYYVSADGTVAECMPKEVDEDGDSLWTDGMFAYSPEAFGENSELMIDYMITNQTDVVYLDGKLWTILKLDMMYAQESALVCYEPEKGWKKAADLPEEFSGIEGMSLAVYRGRLYLMGGLDLTSGKNLTQVLCMDPTALKWEKALELPEARAFAKAVQTGDKLVVTLGRNDEETVPKTLVFDGKTWKTSAADLGNVVTSDAYYQVTDDFEVMEYFYYTAQVHAVKDGIVYTGIQVEDLGDTLFYQVAADKYVSSGYTLPITDGNENVFTACVQDNLYVLRDTPETLGVQSEIGNVTILSMPVQSPCITVSGAVADGGYIEGLGHYLPGDIVTLTANAEDGWFVKSFGVNGTSVKKNKNGVYQCRFAAGTTGNAVSASLQVGVYVMEVMVDQEAELSPGGSYTLAPFCFPENADNQKLTWKSSNPAVVSVKSDGTIAAAKNAKTGTQVVITATASDRGTVSAACTVTIVDPVLPHNGDPAISGGLMYMVTKSTKSQKTVTCLGFSGSKTKSKVTIPSTIKISGYTYKVTGIYSKAFSGKKIKTVTIGSNVKTIAAGAFENCKSLKKITIKGKSLTKIGKKAFRGVGKKAVVRVPKKQKKSYASKLKKAGYKGKVK